MDTLLGPTPLSWEPPDGHPEEDRDEGFLENEGSYPDPEMLSYIDSLCSQVDFVTKVGWDAALGCKIQKMTLPGP